MCGAITALLHGAANLTSCELAEAVGTFEPYDENREPFLEVMQMHRDAVDQIDPACPQELRDAARDIWDDVLVAGPPHGFRNAQATVLAPTGTISFMMDCDTTGIEPDIALVKYKQLAGGGMLKIINRTVPMALQTLGYDEPKIESILAYIEENDTIEGSPDVDPAHLSVFDCAFTPRNGERSIAWRAHITMMAAAQPFLSGAISKTVNMPRDTTTEEIAEAYTDGWKLGLKALAIYRDGSKESQPLATSTEGDRGKSEPEIRIVAKPLRRRLPDTRQSITHKFSVSGHEGYITVGLYPDNTPGELFITMAKEGSTIGGLMDAFGTSVSMSLQYGVPLEDYVRKFSHMRFEPQGFTKNPDIRIAKSLIDYIFRWLGITFLPGYKEANQGKQPDDGGKLPSGGDGGDSEKEPGPVARKTDGQKADQRGERRVERGEERLEAGDRRLEEGLAAELAPREKHQLAPRDEPSHSAIRNPQSEFDAHTDGPTNGHANGANGFANGHANGHSNGSSAKLLERAGVMLYAPARSGVRGTEFAANGGEAAARNVQFAEFQLDAPSCDNCGSITVRNGNCYLCHNCGSSMGCS
jgi:ribonucleoside-diphosphate reductase alpha chain